MFDSTDTTPFLWKNTQSADFQVHMAKQTEEELLETYKSARIHSYTLGDSIVCWNIYQELGRRHGFRTTEDMLDMLDMKEQDDWVERMVSAVMENMENIE